MSLIKQFLTKVACCHDWKEFKQIDIVTDEYKYPTGYKYVLICKNCGKIKIVTV